MPNSTPRSPLTSIASTTKSSSIRAWDIIHRSSSNAWPMPSKVSTKSDEDQGPERRTVSHHRAGPPHSTTLEAVRNGNGAHANQGKAQSAELRARADTRWDLAG